MCECIYIAPTRARARYITPIIDYFIGLWFVYLYIYPSGTLLQKSFKIRSWVPSLQTP